MRPPAARILAFVAGAAAMALEILGSRWLAPVFGFTLTNWAVLIAVTLGAGSAGAWLGGRLATRTCNPALPVLVGAAWIAADGVCAPWFVDWLLPLSLAPGVVLAASALILVPVAALATLVPLLLQEAHGPAGRSAGSLLAASTAGSLAGTLLTALWAVPELGLRTTALVLAALLCASATLARVHISAGATVLAVLVFAFFPATSHAEADLVRETPYGQLRLQRTTRGVTLRMDGIAQATLSPLATGRGALLQRRQYVELLPYLRPTGRTALDIGLGGGLVATTLAAYGIAVESIELDPQVVALAREQLGFSGPVTVGDGRALLRRSTVRFAFVVLDAFRGEAPPAHLLTREAFAQAHDHLEPGGILCIHLIGWPHHEATAAVARTLAQVFAELLCLRSGQDPGELQDLFLLASEQPLRVPPHPDLAAAGWLGNEAFTPDLTAAPVLTDNCNPFERLAADAARALRIASRTR